MKILKIIKNIFTTLVVVGAIEAILFGIDASIAVKIGFAVFGILLNLASMVKILDEKTDKFQEADIKRDKKNMQTAIDQLNS